MPPAAEPVQCGWQNFPLVSIEAFTFNPKESLMNYISRQKQLAALLRRGGFDALLVTHLPNIRYLCGFTGTAGVLLFQVSDRAHKATFYTDGRYTQQAHDEVQERQGGCGQEGGIC